MVESHYTHCCAVQELDGISTVKDCKEALKDVFESIRDCPKKYRHLEIASFYIFTGVVGVKGRKRSHKTYGEKLAKYLSKLGEVSTGSPEYNRMNHPSHLVKVWVWRPDVEKLSEWIDKNIGYSDSATGN